MNIVLITTNKRTELLKQTLLSLMNNAVRWQDHTLTVVLDGTVSYEVGAIGPMDVHGLTVIENLISQGASASRNIGASSIPTYRRQKYVMFSDDDCYYVKGWDRAIEELLDTDEDGTMLVSGHAHPFNRSLYENPLTFGDVKHSFSCKPAGVLSTVNIAMTWKMWDEVGYWTEPGGPGGSEDVEWCARAESIKVCGMAVTEPQVVIHTGLTSSRGEPIVGADMVRERNSELEVVHGIVGEVRYE